MPSLLMNKNPTPPSLVSRRHSRSKNGEALLLNRRSHRRYSIQGWLMNFAIAHVFNEIVKLIHEFTQFILGRQMQEHVVVSTRGFSKSLSDLANRVQDPSG